MGYIRLVNPATGQVILEEYDDGTIRVISEEIRKKMEESFKEGHVPTAEELEELVRQVEEEEGDVFVSEGVVPYEGGPVIDSDTWDASAARERIAKWASSDGSGDKDKINWSKYKKAFLIVDGDPENFGSYKYPHHDVRDGKLCVHRKGVITAMAFLMKTNPPGKRAAYDHLRRHYEALDMEPPEYKESAYTDQEWKEYLAKIGILDEE